MSNLSELLPTGGGQNAVDFVATGNLASGQTVALKTDGTVEAVAETSPSLDSFQGVFGLSLSASYSLSSVYVPTQDRTYFFWSDGSNMYNSSGTYNGTSWSFSAVSSAMFSAKRNWAVNVFYDSSLDKAVIVYELTGGYIGRTATARVLTFSGSTVSFGSAAEINYYGIQPDITGDNNGVFAASYTYYVGNSFGVRQITISGTSIVLGGDDTAMFANGGYGNTAPVAYCDSIDRYVMEDVTSSGTRHLTLFSIVGTTPTLVSGVNLSSSGNGSAPAALSWNSDAAKLYAFYENSSTYATVAICSVTASTISVDSNTVISSTTIANNQRVFSSAYNPDVKQVFIGMTQSTTTAPVKYAVLSGTSPTFDVSATDMYSSSDGSGVIISTSGNAGRFYIGFALQSAPSSSFVYGSGYAATLTGTSNNSSSFIGITSEAISNAATGAINTYGGINEAQTGLTIGSDYYVQTDGSLSTASASPAIKVGQAISATTINMKDLT
jgi:hypothetical protein|tara:strand:- start:1238 stop:2725 length:1488 start_codon:yes stop_codon:yes gene_type:complete